MNITADCDGTFLRALDSAYREVKAATYHGLHIRFFLQHLSCLLQSQQVFELIQDNLTLSHNLNTSLSASCLQFIRLSIHPSSVGIDWVSVTGDRP